MNRSRWLDLQDVRYFSGPKVEPAPPPPKMSDADVQAALASEQERARRRKGRAATIIAGLYPDQSKLGSSSPLGGTT